MEAACAVRLGKKWLADICQKHMIFLQNQKWKANLESFHFHANEEEEIDGPANTLRGTTPCETAQSGMWEVDRRPPTLVALPHISFHS